MSYYDDIIIEMEQSYYKDGEDIEREDKGICEVCGTEYTYWYYKDNIIGFRSTDEVIKPCKCGKHYGYIRENHDGYRYYEDSGKYVR